MRLIDADELLKKIKEISHYDDHDVLVVDWDDMIICIDNAPAISLFKLAEDAEPVRHGKWEVNNTYGYMDMTCSVCGWLYEYYLGLEDEWNFCPNCGAKMEPKE